MPSLIFGGLTSQFQRVPLTWHITYYFTLPLVYLLLVPSSTRKDSDILFGSRTDHPSLASRSSFDTCCRRDRGLGSRWHISVNRSYGSVDENKGKVYIVNKTNNYALYFTGSELQGDGPGGCMVSQLLISGPV